MSRDPVAHWVDEPVDDVSEPVALARAVVCTSPPRLGQRSRAGTLLADAWVGAMGFVSVRVVLALVATGLAFGVAVGPRKMKCCFGGGKGDDAKATVKKYAYEAYPSWRAQHPALVCPASLDDLNEYTNNNDVIDPWGSPYLASCDTSGRLLVWSAGEDQQFETDDDIRSDQ